MTARHRHLSIPVPTRSVTFHGFAAGRPRSPVQTSREAFPDEHSQCPQARRGLPRRWPGGAVVTARQVQYEPHVVADIQVVMEPHAAADRQVVADAAADIQVVVEPHAEYEAEVEIGL